MLRPLAVAAVAFALALGVYAPALRGPFLSDDYFYLNGNPTVRQLSFENAAAILDPTGDVARSVQNYAPVYLLVESLAWRAFGEDTRGHHALQLAAHATASALLVELFVASGLALPAALAGGALFLLHPANVEAVAWISQLRTTISLALALGALLAFARRPGLGVALFALALGAKATALFALPVAAVAAWTRVPPDDAPARRRALRWIAAWVAVAVLYALAQLPANLHTNAGAPPIHPDLGVRVQSLIAIAGRYLAMAATGTGLSTFHEPAPTLRLADPWLALGALGLVAIGLRALRTLRARRMEAAYWTWAAAGFAPVSQVVPFLYPMADRYLYTILPGLLGGALLALQAALAGLEAPARRRAGVALVATACLVAGVFAVQGRARAAIWATPGGIVDDAIAHYPDGTSARIRRAQVLVLHGQPDDAVRELQRVKPFALEMNALVSDGVLMRLRGQPGFDALLRDVATRWIEFGRANDRLGQGELRQIALAHLLRGEPAEARAVLERALAQGGPRSDEIRADLESVANLEATLRAREARAPRSTPPDPGGTPPPAGP